MMHVDKNVDCHVVDQNVDQISGEIVYVPLDGGIRSKRSSCMQIFFLFLLMSSRHAYLRSRIYGDFSHVFLRTKGSGSWLMFSEDLGFLDLGSCFFRGPRVFWALAHVFKGPKVLDLGSYFQRT